MTATDYRDVLLPRLALSVRQPWAYALANGWKDVENRDWRSPNPALNFRGPFCIHAPRGMTRAEYIEARDFLAGRGCKLPLAADLLRGGIVGVGVVVDIMRKSGDRLDDRNDRAAAAMRSSRWFFGPVGILIERARPVPFVAAAGELNFFEWRRALVDRPAEPAMWMIDQGAREADLFGSA